MDPENYQEQEFQWADQTEDRSSTISSPTNSSSSEEIIETTIHKMKNIDEKTLLITYDGGDSMTESIFRGLGPCTVTCIPKDEESMPQMIVKYQIQLHADKAKRIENHTLSRKWSTENNKPEWTCTPLASHSKDNQQPIPTINESNNQERKISIIVPATQDQNYIKNLFAAYGKIENFDTIPLLNKEKDGGTDKLINFISYSTRQEALRAKEDCHPKFRPRWATEQEQLMKTTMDQEQSDNKILALNTVYVRLLNNDKSILDQFKDFGKIKSTRITQITDKATKMPMLVAFVEYEKEAEAAKAIRETYNSQGTRYAYERRNTQNYEEPTASNIHVTLAHNKTLYVLMPKRISLKEFVEDFQKFEGLIDYDRKTSNQDLNVGFLTYETKRQAIRALVNAPTQYEVSWKILQSTATHTMHNTCGEMVPKNMWKIHNQNCSLENLVKIHKREQEQKPQGQVENVHAEETAQRPPCVPNQTNSTHISPPSAKPLRRPRAELENLAGGPQNNQQDGNKKREQEDMRKLGAKIVEALLIAEASIKLELD